MAETLYVETDYWDNEYVQTGIEVIWKNHEVFVPKIAMVLIQSTPVEIYQLNIPEFKAILGDLLDDAPGMVEPDIFSHNPSVSISGVILSVVLEILPPYTITFEDSKYNVNVVGGNSNISDRTNKNQVGVNTANSAGLQDLSTLLASAYQGRVVVDTGNITGIAQSGTDTPIGTYGHPVDNIPDAVTIAGLNGIGELFIIGNLTLDVGDDVSNLNIIGSAPTLSFIMVNDAAQTLKTQFSRCTLAGVLDGYSTLEDSVLWDMAYFSGTMRSIALTDSIITLGGNNSAVMLHCYAATAGGGTPTIDMGGSGQSLTMGNYNGDIKLINKTGTDSADIYLNAGKVIIDSTITNGVINVYGGVVVNNSTGSTVVNHYRAANKQDVINASQL